MRYLFVFLLLVHGLIHLMGFAKAFKYAEISQLTTPISRTSGTLWLLTALVFVAAAVLLLFQKDNWWMVAAPAMILSQWLIFISWQDAKFGSIANGIILLATIIGFGTWSFFNDMCCMAPATLIDKRIQWLEVIDHKVRASFTNNGIMISAWLIFNEQGELVNFMSEDRFAAGEDNTMKRLPWSTPLSDYKTLDGYKLPGYAETIYTYPEGDLCYGTFRLAHVEYNCKDFKHK